MTCSLFTTPAATCFGHTGRVFGLAYHPCSHQVLASASEDETVRVWSRSTPTGSWQQASCCRGHTAEVLRVAWSPDGNILASGSADHTVRLWQVGTQGNHSYSGVELAVLSGHPEEVYGLKFISTSTGSSNTSAAAAAGHQHAGQAPLQQQQPGISNYDVSNTLVTASGESLFLWDLHTGQMLHECAPLPVAGMSELSVDGKRPSRRKGNASSSTKQQAAAVGDRELTAGPSTAGVQPQQADQQGSSEAEEVGQQQPESQQQMQQQQWQQQQEEQPIEEAEDEAAQEEEDEQKQDGPPMLSYIFSLAAAEGTSWLAGACADGMLRLWDAGGSRLQEVAAVQVHVGDMGSVCSFVPGQPWLILTISKSGQLVLQDIRLLGQALLAQQLQGPVYDMAWAIQQQQQQQQGQVPLHADAAAAAGVAGGAAGAAGAELQLCVVGRDSCVRSYAFGREALLAGYLQEPQLQAMPEAYSGRLLALAATPDGRALAAAGEAVPAGTLKPAAAQQQQHHHHQQQQQEELPQGLCEVGSSSASRPSAAAHAAAAVSQVPQTQVPDVAVAAAAAVPAVVARRRKGRSVRPAGAAVDLFNMTDDADVGCDDADRALQSQQQQQQQLVAAGNGSSDAGSSGQQAASSLEGSTARLAAGDASAEVQLPACAAAAAGILMRAPLFTWTNS